MRDVRAELRLRDAIHEVLRTYRRDLDSYDRQDREAADKRAEDQLLDLIKCERQRK